MFGEVGQPARCANADTAVGQLFDLLQFRKAPDTDDGFGTKQLEAHVEDDIGAAGDNLTRFASFAEFSEAIIKACRFQVSVLRQQHNCLPIMRPARLVEVSRPIVTC